MSEVSTIASLATAGGTLILAVATFSSTRSANRAARVSEAALKVGLRPVLFNARPQDEPQKVGFIDEHWIHLHDGLAAIQEDADRFYLSIPLRNVGSGLAVLHGWYPWPGRELKLAPPRTEEFRQLSRDLYVPAGDIGFWQSAVRDRDDPLYERVSAVVQKREPFTIDILYGDHEGGQRTVTRFGVQPRSQEDEEPWMWACTTSRHWNLDRADPREHPEPGGQSP